MTYACDGTCEWSVRCALEYHLAVYIYGGEWGGRLLPGSCGSVVSALDFQTLILSSIPSGSQSFSSAFITNYLRYILLWNFAVEPS